MTDTNLYNVGYDVGYEDGFNEAEGRVKELEARLKEEGIVMIETTTSGKSPYIIKLKGDELFIFTLEHTYEDIAQWIFNEGGADEVMYHLTELKGG